MFRSCLNGNIVTKPPRKSPYTPSEIECDSDITHIFSAFDLVQHENNPKCRDLNLWVVDALMEKTSLCTQQVKKLHKPVRNSLHYFKPQKGYRW